MQDAVKQDRLMTEVRLVENSVIDDTVIDDSMLGLYDLTKGHNKGDTVSAVTNPTCETIENSALTSMLPPLMLIRDQGSNNMTGF